MAHPKGLLMERLKKQGVSPEFRTANTGPDHEPTFLTDVVVNGEVLGTGQGGNKREAERLAAEEALAYLDRNPLELETIAPEKGSRSRKSEQKSTAKSQPPAEPEGAKRSPKTQKSPSRTEETTRAAPEAGERFEGPWPIFENLLAGIVEVAGERVDEELKGEEARIAVRDFTLELYKDLLEDLGDIVEEEDEAEE
jgi:ribonuclease-3